MMDEFYSRTYGIYGDDLDKIIRSHVAVIGLGGVGGQAAIALCRSGVGKITLIDGDKVVRSNLNRQAAAFVSTLGMPKARACEKILKDINPGVDIDVYECFWTKDNIDIDLSDCDIILDCIDSVKDKTDLIGYAHDKGIEIISAMGAGNKTDPSAFRVCDISKTSVDPLSRVMRKRLKDMGITHTRVVFSEEIPVTPFSREEEKDQGVYKKRVSPASTSFVPPAAGLVMAGEAIRILTQRD